MRKVLLLLLISVIYVYGAADIAIIGVSPNLDGWVSDTLVDTLSYFTVIVANIGNTRYIGNVRTYYSVDSGGATIVDNVQIGRKRNFNVGEADTYKIDWNPSIYHMAEYDLYVYHDASDGNSSNDTVKMHFIIRGHQGRDGYGWVWRDTYSLLGAPGGVQWIELNGDTSAQNLNLRDEDTAHVALASGIKFYGYDYDSIWVSANGILSFNIEPSPYQYYYNDSIPSYYAQDARALMPFWDDLDPGSGGAVYYRTFSDTLTVIEWYQVPKYNTYNYFTFEVQITSNLAGNGVYDNITFVYYNMQYDTTNSTMDATIGIQDSAGTNGYLYFTYNEQPYTPRWNSNWGTFAIKFYSPEALGVNENRPILAKPGHSIITSGVYSFYIPSYKEVYVRDITGRLLKVKQWRRGDRVYIDFTRLRRGIYYIEGDGKGKVIKVLNMR